MPCSRLLRCQYAAENAGRISGVAPKAPPGCSRIYNVFNMHVLCDQPRLHQESFPRALLRLEPRRVISLYSNSHSTASVMHCSVQAQGHTSARIAVRAHRRILAGCFCRHEPAEYVTHARSASADRTPVYPAAFFVKHPVRSCPIVSSLNFSLPRWSAHSVFRGFPLTLHARSRSQAPETTTPPRDRLAEPARWTRPEYPGLYPATPPRRDGRAPTGRWPPLRNAAACALRNGDMTASRQSSSPTSF